MFSVDFPINNLLDQYKDQIISDYYKSIKESDGTTYSHLITIPEVLNIVKPLWLDVINNNFKSVPKSRKPFQIWAYIQNNSNNRSVWHNHPEAELNTVFYLNTPLKGGELLVLENDPSKNKHEVTHIKVKPNKLYVMPFWQYHKPQHQEDKDERICFNIQYFSEDGKRLIHKSGKNW